MMTKYLRWLVISILMIIIVGLVIMLVFILRNKPTKTVTDLSSQVNTSTIASSTTALSSGENSSCGAHSYVSTSVASRLNLSTFWSFDSNTLDLFSRANASAINNPMYFAGYIGLGQCIMFDGIDQFAYAPFIPLNNQSFTIELFVFLNIFSSTGRISILRQCAMMNKSDQCLSLAVANSTLLFSFNNDNLIGTTRLVDNRWYHFAFVFDIETLMQRIYLNGTLDGSRTVTSAYLGRFGNTTIGYDASLPVSSLFPGYMDNLSIYRGRAKSDNEIMNDFMLYSYYSWNDGLPTDDGPNWLDGNLFGTTSFDAGYSEMGLNFSSGGSYFMADGFRILGVQNHSFSASIWVKPSSFGGTILHIAHNSDGTGNCYPILGLALTGEPAAVLYDAVHGIYSTSSVDPLPLNQWSHLVETFSVNNGVRLYVNGTLKANRSALHNTSGNTMKLFVGSGGIYGDNDCSSAGIQAQQYLGSLDELRVFNTEITQDDVCALAAM